MSCECGTGLPSIVSLPDSASSGIDVRGIGDIKVTSSDELGKKVFTVSFEEFTPPVINATANPLREVGAEVDFTWNVDIQQGREVITERSITPLPDPAPDLTDPFTVSVEDKKVTSRQSVTYHAVSVKDAINTIVNRNLAISFVNKVYVGFLSKDGVSGGQGITDSDILSLTGTLSDTIKSSYGGQKNYVLPPSGVNKYIYWAYEVGTTPINSMTLSGLPFPLVFIPGSVSVDNPQDGSISVSYAVVRSANKFGNGTLSITML